MLVFPWIVTSDRQPVAGDVQGASVPLRVEDRSDPPTGRPEIGVERSVVASVPGGGRGSSHGVSIYREPQSHFIGTARARCRRNGDDRVGPRPVRCHQAPIAAIYTGLESCGF
jgi:hypothetical protein